MKKVVYAAICLVVFAIVPAGNASGLDPNNLDDRDVLLISRKCTDIRRALLDTQYNDTLTRVSRGNGLGSIITLMSSLNSRASQNTYNIPELITATNNTQTLKRQFSDNYTNYEIQMRDLLALDCKADPVEFYRKLVTVRASRALLAANIKNINQQLGLYMQSVTTLRGVLKTQ